MWETILWTLFALFAAAVLVKVLVLLLEPRLTFLPLRGLNVHPGCMEVAYRRFPLATADGETLQAWHLDNLNAEAEIVFFHGSRGNLSSWSSFLCNLHGHGYTVSSFDYRGYGESTGKPSEAGLYEDTQAFSQRFWTELHQVSKPVVYWGRSLGGAMAAFACTLHPPDALILEAAFPDLRSLLKRRPFVRLLATFGRYRFPTLEFLEKVDCPVLVVHGDADPVVAIEIARRMYELIRSPKEFFPVAGADHGNLPEIDPAEYWRRVSRFIARAPLGHDPN